MGPGSGGNQAQSRLPLHFGKVELPLHVEEDVGLARQHSLEVRLPHSAVVKVEPRLQINIICNINIMRKKKINLKHTQLSELQCPPKNLPIVKLFSN